MNKTAVKQIAQNSAEVHRHFRKRMELVRRLSKAHSLRKRGKL